MRGYGFTESGLEVGDIYLVIRECGEIECAFKSTKDAEECKKDLEEMTDGNTTWNIVKTYCY